MTKYKINERISIRITRPEADFDRACDAAHKVAMRNLGCDDCGHLTNVENTERSQDAVKLTFMRYEATFSMAGPSHEYFFEARVVRG